MVQTAPPDHPTLRTHRIAIGLYDGGVRRDRVELDVAGARTEVPALVGRRRPELLLLNDDDLTYAKIRLDPKSWAAAVSGIGGFADPLPQAVCWTIAWDMVRDAELAARDYLSLVLSGVASHTPGPGEEPVPDPPPRYLGADLASLVPSLVADLAG